MAIRSGGTLPERFEKHAPRNWVNLGFNHKTTLTMGCLVPMGIKEVFPGELAKCRMEVQMKFANLFLPIMHQCYFTVDWFYVRTGALYAKSPYQSFEAFIMQHPVTGTIEWAWMNYARADAVFTDGIFNYMGFNAPPGAGVLIAQQKVSAIPAAAYYSIYTWMFRNPNIQQDSTWLLLPGDNSAGILAAIPDLRCLRRNWPRDYYTIATPEPQMGANVLIPSYATDPVTGLFVPQQLMKLTGATPGDQPLWSNDDSGTPIMVGGADTQPIVLQLSATIRDLTYARDMTEFLERATRAGATGTGIVPGAPRWNDFVKRYFDWNPNPLMIDMPVWIGGYTGDIMISDVMSTAEAGTQKVGSYAGKAVARDNTPMFTYQIPDYGVIIPIMTVYPKASYYTGPDNIWFRETKMDYLWEQFALIGDQPMRNREVWFSWYDADIAWNEEIFGYVPQYNQFRFSNDIVSGQMRTLWESFHLGRKFDASGDVILNSDFITCTPDIGRVFDVDAEAGEHECFVHAYIAIDVLRRLPKFGLPDH